MCKSSGPLSSNMMFGSTPVAQANPYQKTHLYLLAIKHSELHSIANGIHSKT